MVEIPNLAQKGPRPEGQGAEHSQPTVDKGPLVNRDKEDRALRDRVDRGATGQTDREGISKTECETQMEKISSGGGEEIIPEMD